MEPVVGEMTFRYGLNTDLKGLENSVYILPYSHIFLLFS
jgi:hypothetical protein